MSGAIKKDEIISIPASPTGTTETISEVEISPATPSSASSSPDSAAPLDAAASGQKSHKPKRDRSTGRSLDFSRKERHLRERFKRCRDKTLESELCRTISKYARHLMSDDQCRRATAIAIIVLAVIGLYHILTTIF